MAGCSGVVSRDSPDGTSATEVDTGAKTGMEGKKGGEVEKADEEGKRER